MAPLEKKGFLGKSVKDWVQNIRAQHPRLFALADEVNELCQSSMFELKPHTGNVHEMIVTTLYFRVVSNYQGTVLLLERGMMPEARVLARAMLEAVFSLVAIGNHPVLAPDYVYEDQNNQLRLVRKIKQLDHRHYPEGTSRSEIENLERELEGDIKANQRRVRSTEDWAREADLHSWYLSAYSLLSMSVHAKVRDLERYLVLDDKGEIQELKGGPDDTGLEEVLLTILEGILVSLECVLRVFGKNKSEKINGLRGNLRTFRPER